MLNILKPYDMTLYESHQQESVSVINPIKRVAKGHQPIGYSAWFRSNFRER
jgi:hypothetical protein